MPALKSTPIEAKSILIEPSEVTVKAFPAASINEATFSLLTEIFSPNLTACPES
jgi:hypothetical protein